MTLTRAQWVQRDLPVIRPKVASNRVIRWVRTAIILAFWAAVMQTIWITLSYSFRMQATAAVLEESLIKMHGACLMLPDAPAHKYDIKWQTPNDAIQTSKKAPGADPRSLRIVTD